MAFVLGMVAAAACDALRRRIPNALNVAIFAGGLLAQAASRGGGGVVDGLAGAGVGLALLLPLFRAGWIGGGDVKLLVAAGAWLGPMATVWSAVLGLALGGILAAAIAVRGGAAFRAEVAANLVNAALMRRFPSVPRRERAKLVPLAVSLAAAAVGVYLA